MVLCCICPSNSTDKVSQDPEVLAKTDQLRSSRQNGSPGLRRSPACRQCDRQSGVEIFLRSPLGMIHDSQLERPYARFLGKYQP